MKKKFFGTDGIRGTYNEFPITTTFFYGLTKAIKLTFRNVNKVIIGIDTRESSNLIESDIIYVKYDAEKLSYMYVCKHCDQKWTNR